MEKIARLTLQGIRYSFTLMQKNYFLAQVPDIMKEPKVPAWVRSRLKGGIKTKGPVAFQLRMDFKKL